MSVNYIRLNAPAAITSSYCSLASAKCTLKNKKSYILHFKCISYKPSNIIIKFKKNDNTEVTIGQFNLMDCEVLDTVNSKNEYYCILKFESNIDSEGRVLIGTNIDSSYIANEKILDIREVALQKGAILLPYSQNVDDDKNKLLELDTKIEQLADSLSLKSSKKETEGLEERISSAEIKLSPEKISFTVLNSEQFSQFKQTNNEFIMDLASSGGSNFVRNGAFKSEDWRNWTKWGSISELVVWKNNEESGHKWACKIVTTTQQQGIQQTIDRLIVGKTYTFNCKVWSTRGVVGAMVNNGGAFNGDHFGGAQNVWGEITFSFVANENTTTLSIGTVNEKCTPGDYWVTGIQVVEGPVKKTWTQHQDETYNTRFIFDNEGLEARFKDGSYTKMEKEGFAWFDSENMSHAYHCLMEVGVFNLMAHGDGNWTKVKIQLPNYFKGKYFKVIVMPSGWSIGESNLVTLTVLLDSYDIANGSFIIKAFANSLNGAFQNNINISWMATA